MSGLTEVVPAQLQYEKIITSYKARNVLRTIKEKHYKLQGKKHSQNYKRKTLQVKRQETFLELEKKNHSWAQLNVKTSIF